MKKYNNIIFYFTCLIILNIISLTLLGIILYNNIIEGNISNITDYTLNIVEIDHVHNIIECKHYTMMDFFSNKKIYYYPSYFVRNESLIDTSFSYKNLNFSFYYEVEIEEKFPKIITKLPEIESEGTRLESEQDFLIGLSNTFLDLMESNKKSIAFFKENFY